MPGYVNETVVFIGGPADGARKIVSPDQDIIELFATQSIGFSVATNTLVQGDFQSGVYRALELHIGGACFRVMTHMGLSDEETVSQLIDGYMRKS